MRAICFAASLALASPLTAGPYDGVYKPDAAWADGWDCTSIGMDGGAVAIRDDTFFGVESACRLTNPVPVRDMSATLFDLQCSGEGETWSTRLMLMSTPEGLLTIRDGGDVTRWIHC